MQERTYNVARPEDPWGIIPRGSWAAVVKPFDFQIRTMAQYDANYLRDEIRSDVFINGMPAGVHAVALVDDRRYGTSKESIQRALEELQPELEEMVIQEFMGIKYRERVKVLEQRITALEDHINRPRWFHFLAVRRLWAGVSEEVARYRRRLAAAIAPKAIE